MNWVDTPLFVYATVQGHPARVVAEQLLRDGEWSASVLNLTECYHVLTTTYGVTPAAGISAIERRFLQDVGA